MIDFGDIHVADLGGERRTVVLVVSNRRFNQLSERLFVAPESPMPLDEVPFPWRIEAEGFVFALDLQRSIPAERLLERTGRLPADAAAGVRRVLHRLI